MVTPTHNRARILVVEDDPSILLGLRMSLEGEGYEIGVAEDGRTGLRRAREEPWDLVILDVMLPQLNGYEVLLALRNEKSPLPVLMLSARSSEMDKVMGLDLGAEDYVTKPFAVGELLARVRVALRRRGAPKDESPALIAGELVIDSNKRQVVRSGDLVDLTATEFDVLSALVKARGRVLSRQQIFDAVWGPSHHGTLRTIDNFVAQLRAKLERDPADPMHLLTCRGIGYRFSLDGK